MDYEIYYVMQDGSKRFELTCSTFSCATDDQAQKRLKDTQAAENEAARRAAYQWGKASPATVYFLRRTA